MCKILKDNSINKLIDALTTEMNNNADLMSDLKDLSMEDQQIYDSLSKNDKDEINNQTQIGRSLISAHRGITRLNQVISKIKSDQTLIQHLINEVHSIKKNGPIRKEEFAEYASNFDIIKDHLNDLTNRQKSTIQQENTWQLRMLNATANNNIVFDKSTILSLAQYIKKYTHQSLSDFISTARKSEVNYELKSLSNTLLIKENNSVHIESKIQSKLDDLSSDFNNYFDNSYHIFIIIGLISFSSAISIASTWLQNFDTHPILTSLITLVIIGVIILVLWKDSDNND